MARSKGTAGYWVLAALIAGLLFFTNPSREAHKAKAYEHMQQKAQKQGFWASVGASTAEGVDALELAGIEYHSYFLGSTVTHDGKTLTIGVLGMVWVVDE